jgi:predicted RNA binding protein YcfA (HicA-like mRNA interferase family)
MSPRLPSCTPTEFERVLRKLGFVEDRQRGSHKVFIRASDNRTVVVPSHNRDLKRGTLHAFVKGTGLTIDEFQKLL